VPNPLTKEAAGQPVWAWGAEIVGAYLVYRWWRNRQAANAATAALGTTSGPPPTSSGDTGTGSTAASSPQSWTDWLNQFLHTAPTAGYSSSQAFNDATAWINGGCVSAQGYAPLSNALQTIGLPPGFGTGLPPIKLCLPPSGGSPPSSTSQLTLIPTPAIAKELEAAGLQIITAPSHTGQLAQYYVTGQLAHIQTPTISKQLQQAGYTIVTIGNSQYYNPQQKITTGHR
jgi:hypothetical protein